MCDLVRPYETPIIDGKSAIDFNSKDALSWKPEKLLERNRNTDEWRRKILGALATLSKRLPGWTVEDSGPRSTRS